MKMKLKLIHRRKLKYDINRRDKRKERIEKGRCLAFGGLSDDGDSPLSYAVDSRQHCLRFLHEGQLALQLGRQHQRREHRLFARFCLYDRYGQVPEIPINERKSSGILI